MEEGAQRCEGARETGEHDDNRKDEPHMICLPHGADRVRDGGALTFRGRASGEEVPDAPPIIGATQ